MCSKLHKVISVMLAVTIILCGSFSFSVFAETCRGDCGICPTIVIPGIFQSDCRYYDDAGNEMLNSEGEPYSKPFFMESSNVIVKSALEKVLAPFAAMLITQQDKDSQCANAIGEVLGQALAGNIMSDSSGNVIKNVRAVKYNTALSNLSAEDRDYALRQIPLSEYVDAAGLDHLYFLSYMSFGNLKQIANELFELIQTAKAETGHDKVNLLPISQGGSIFNALIQLYKDKGLSFEDDVNRVCFIVPACDGAAVLGDIYHNGLLDDDDALYGYMFPSLMEGEESLLAYIITFLLRIMPNADINKILDAAVDILIEDYLEYSTCIWGLIPSKDYPACREKFLTDAEDAEIREQTDWYYNAQLNSRSNILAAQKNGVEFFDIADYDYTLYKICDSWDKVNGDGIIQLDSTSFGAVSAPVGKTLAEDYVQQGTYCSNPAHNHIDENRIVDASTGILCESTFYFKGQDHEKTARNDVIIRLAVRILIDESFTGVYSDPAFPQFNFARDSRDFIKLYDSWKNFDSSLLPAKQAVRFDAALTRAEKAINSTMMPTSEFNAAKEELNAITYEITNGAPMEAEQINKLLELFTKLVAWLSDVMLGFFGGAGYSEIMSLR